MSEPQWYYFRDRCQHGPFAESELQRLFQQGKVPLDSGAWVEGMSEWKPAVELLPFSNIRVIPVSVSPLPESVPAPSPALKSSRLRPQPKANVPRKKMPRAAAGRTKRSTPSSKAITQVSVTKSAHVFMNDVCIRCGLSSSAIQHFGWQECAGGGPPVPKMPTTPVPASGGTPPAQSQSGGCGGCLAILGILCLISMFVKGCS